MLSPHVTFLVAQQHVADLHRAVDHQRLAHATIDVRSSHADAPDTFVRRLRRRLTHPVVASR